MTEKSKVIALEKAIEDLYKQVVDLRAEVEGLKIEHANLIGLLKRRGK